jgi:FkbM family methyltransferase
VQTLVIIVYFFAKECKFHTVDCYELSDKIYNVLLKNQKLNNCININTLNLGLSDKVKRVGVSKIDEKNIGMTHIVEGNTVELSTLDIIYKNFTNKIGLIKIDTEGSEYDILVGGINTIKEHSPLLVIEIQNEEIFKKINGFLEIIKYKTNKISYFNIIH